MDKNDNLKAAVVLNEELHEVHLDFTHRPMRSGGKRIQILKDEAESLNTKFVDNLVRNVNDQNRRGTVFEIAADFNLHRKKCFFFGGLGSSCVKPKQS